MWHFLSMSRTFWKFDLFLWSWEGHLLHSRWQNSCKFWTDGICFAHFSPSLSFFNSSSLHLPLFSWSISYACGKVCARWQRDKSARSFHFFFVVSSIKGTENRATWELLMNATVIKLLFFNATQKRLIFTRMLAVKLLHKVSHKAVDGGLFLPCESTESLYLDGRTAFSLCVRMQQS